MFQNSTGFVPRITSLESALMSGPTLDRSGSDALRRKDGEGTSGVHKGRPYITAGD